jgi:hypothetical protein|tara:strand:- start:1172 stop:2038 length:867 start_codon:yes stop_codon:yes gene_type:complete
MNRDYQLITAKYTLFGSPKYWILTNHGISTNFLVETGHSYDDSVQSIDINFDFNTLDIINSDDNIGKKEFNNFKIDWKQILLGKSIKKDIIFLTKNPINRLIQGIVDEKLQILENHNLLSSLILKTSLYTNFGKKLSDEFSDWHDSKQFHELFQEDISIPLEFKKILEQIILDFIIFELKNDNIKECINLYYKSNHTYQNLYFLHNMWFKPPTNFLKEKVSIIDIDRECLLKVFNNKYGMGLFYKNNSTSPYSAVLDVLQNREDSLYEDIEVIMNGQVVLWKSLIKRQ